MRCWPYSLLVAAVAEDRRMDENRESGAAVASGELRDQFVRTVDRSRRSKEAMAPGQRWTDEDMLVEPQRSAPRSYSTQQESVQAATGTRSLSARSRRGAGGERC